MDIDDFAATFSRFAGMPLNPYHPLVWILGDPEIGENVAIGGLTEINASGAKLVIGEGCDIASFVSINCSDSHRRAIGVADQIERRDIVIEDHVFIGSHSVVKGGAHIGHHTVIAAGTIVDGVDVPPYSLVFGNPMKVKESYYQTVIE